MTKPDFNKVIKVYNGKSGCMCGCNGNWGTSVVNQFAAAKDCGYAYSADQINDKRVKMIMTKVFNSPDVKIDQFGDMMCAYIDNGSRTSAVYFVA